MHDLSCVSRRIRTEEENAGKQRETLMRIYFSWTNRIFVSFPLLQQSHSTHSSHYLCYLCAMGGANRESQNARWDIINDQTRYLRADKRYTLVRRSKRDSSFLMLRAREKSIDEQPATATFFRAIRFYQIQFDSWRWSDHKCSKITPKNWRATKRKHRKSVEIFFFRIRIQNLNRK